MEPFIRRFSAAAENRRAFQRHLGMSLRVSRPRPVVSDVVTHTYFSRARLRVGVPPMCSRRSLALKGDSMAEQIEIEQVLADPAASFWLKEALRSALTRDPVDAANDAEVLARLLDRRCQEILKRG